MSGKKTCLECGGHDIITTGRFAFENKFVIICTNPDCQNYGLLAVAEEEGEQR